MGIGLSAQGVNMNRLPGKIWISFFLYSSFYFYSFMFMTFSGWDKHSYGYHGDDGHSFCSSGTGQPYGPTFTTGDVIGCGVNLIDNTCFYTKNGHNLGVAFTDLPVSCVIIIWLIYLPYIISMEFIISIKSFIVQFSSKWRVRSNAVIW